MILTAYDQHNLFENLVKYETIDSGTTKRFAITGTVQGKGIWKAGEELGGDSGISGPGWFDISLDQRPSAAYFDLDKFHQAMSDFEYRKELARQAALTLTYMNDKKIACMIAKGAFTAAREPYTNKYAGMNHSSYGGQALSANAKFNHLGNRFSTDTQRADAALLLLRYIEIYNVNCAEQDVPPGTVYCAVTPQAFHDIRALGIARDSTDLIGGAGRPFFGGVADAGGLGVGLTQGLFGIRESLEYMNVKIVKSNHLSQLDHMWIASGETDVARTLSGSTGLAVNGSLLGVDGELGDAKYNFNWAQSTGPVVGDGDVDTGDVIKPVKALIWQPDAVCSIRLQGLQVETERDVRRGLDFTVASIFGGAGVIRPELCGAVQGLYEV